ncbi:hypothetical protein SAMN02745221_02234 [Thermosyntropha lipolytica DSM 11003]|uniref:Uncharacterized protein n=1 Tax=Thermosyntropha lipolytica DSM 11003 TaxID=1123382 RepID=A0A1M5SJQ1_9FIRM|nr:hypothetical protein [Thermosyntropha lipolytica]SHH38685.1 hypothetical protein SAMN02745221_02234 [Thermosyntropha lipolytica DSM 11003]
MKKKIALIVLIAFILSIFPINTVLATTGNIAVSRDGVEIIDKGKGTGSNPDIIQARRTKDQTKVDHIYFYNQSTIGSGTMDGKGYRTIGYDMTLYDEKKNKISETYYFDYGSYREEYLAYMRNKIRNTPGWNFGDSYVSEEYLYRDFLLKYFKPEVLDTAKYLKLDGHIELFNRQNGVYHRLYLVTKDNLDKTSDYPSGFAKYYKDFKTRFPFIDLNPPVKGPDFYPTPDFTNQYNYEWKYKPARTYMGEPGQQINVEVYLWNGGTETATTNIAATWWGSGWTA